MCKQEPFVMGWDETFMQMANLMGKRSKDLARQVGAVLVDENHVVLGLGYNGWPRGIENDALPWARKGDFLDVKYTYVVHAEINAIFNAHKDVRGGTLYCNLFPCNECAQAIIQTGIKEVVFSGPARHDVYDDVWEASRRMFDLVGIIYRQYNPAYDMQFNKKEEN